VTIWSAVWATLGRTDKTSNGKYDDEGEWRWFTVWNVDRLSRREAAMRKNEIGIAHTASMSETWVGLWRAEGHVH
jgi:hypothetical protein